MEWKKHIKNSGYTRYELKRYPFIEAYITEYRGEFGLGYMFDKHSNKKFNTLNKAKQYVERRLTKIFNKIDLDLITTIEELNLIKHITVNYTKWCNNNGNGKYIHNNIWKNYQWIEGRFLHTTGTAHRYAIRKSIYFPEHYVRSFAVNVVKRHIKRFLNDTVTLENN